MPRRRLPRPRRHVAPDDRSDGRAHRRRDHGPVAIAANPVAATAAVGDPGRRRDASQVTRVTVALDWYPWANHTGLYLARERGYYRGEGLEVELYVPANPEDGLKLVAAGRDTFGISYQTDVLLARGEGVPVKSIAALVQLPLNSDHDA